MRTQTRKHAHARTHADTHARTHLTEKPKGQRYLCTQQIVVKPPAAVVDGRNGNVAVCKASLDEGESASIVLHADLKRCKFVLASQHR